MSLTSVRQRRIKTVPNPIPDQSTGQCVSKIKVQYRIEIWPVASVYRMTISQTLQVMFRQSVQIFCLPVYRKILVFDKHFKVSVSTHTNNFSNIEKTGNISDILFVCITILEKFDVWQTLKSFCLHKHKLLKHWTNRKHFWYSVCVYHHTGKVWCLTNTSKFLFPHTQTISQTLRKPETFLIFCLSVSPYWKSLMFDKHLKVSVCTNKTFSNIEQIGNISDILFACMAIFHTMTDIFHKHLQCSVHSSYHFWNTENELANTANFMFFGIIISVSKTCLRNTLNLCSFLRQFLQHWNMFEKQFCFPVLPDVGCWAWWKHCFCESWSWSNNKA